ncbi:hypothetical protein I350_03167 [Cryptococcus amylolentus CBS 6273]|uniref:Uncharacterized protein n=1 Tax=Cryptococcus amylolentus CBS 6273 TaxID=1296118 RepID=A0A1E3K8Q1_9TREE|nr:hypothetical protein I350_03167 [Cryptococcus amylolentus CBS 6273]
MSSQDHDALSVKDPRIASSANSTMGEDDAALAKMGYKASLARRWGQLESFAAAFCAMQVSLLIVAGGQG